jgi:hypothetical protein
MIIVLNTNKEKSNIYLTNRGFIQFGGDGPERLGKGANNKKVVKNGRNKLYRRVIRVFKTITNTISCC